MRFFFKARLAALLAFFLFPQAFAESPQNNFVYTQIQHAGEWDPYPMVWPALRDFLTRSTSLQPWKERRVIALEDSLSASSSRCKATSDARG